MSGELIKLKITAYSNPGFTDEIANGEFKTLLNPDKYTFKYKIEQNEEQASGTSALAPRFNKALPEDLDLEFVFDRTGVIIDYGSPSSDKDNVVYKDEGNGVIDDIESFKHVVFEYNGTEHRPNYLEISWGTLLFKGTLSEMDITFKLFKPSGMPLRAVAKAKFKGFVEDNLRVAMENNQSPDLTHIKTVKAGDTLPLMAYRVYGDSKYYLEVAKVNRLTNFRQLKAGQKIVFPPIKKV